MPYIKPSLPRLFTCLLIALAGSALCSAASAATACVWRVTNVPVPFYLVGTIHRLSGKDYPLPKAYDQALHDSQRLLFELDPNPKSNFGKIFARAGVYPRGDSMPHHLHAGTWEFLAKNLRISNYLGKRQWQWGDYQFDTVEELRPWAIAYYIWGVHGYNDAFGRYGVDNHISYQARRMGKETAGLETDEEHVDVLRGMTDIDSELILLDALTRGDKRRDDFNELRAAWKKGDIATIWAREQRFRNLSPGASLRLLDERNVRWIPRLKAEMKTGKPTAIVVGCAHFPGPNGLIALLQRAGYKIEQL